MTNLPPIPQKEGVDRNWSPETWRAGWDEACKRSGCYGADDVLTDPETDMIAAHATTLIEAGIIKPVVSEAAGIWAQTYHCFGKEVEASRVLNSDFGDFEEEHLAAIAIIQSALDKARAGE